MKRLLTHATVVTMNSNRDVLEDGAIYLQDDRIVAVGATEAMLPHYPDAELMDCRDRVIIPGMVNTHTHLFQTLLKGLGDDRVLKDWFCGMTGPSATQLVPEDCYAAARHGCVEAIKSGTTTLVDFMYAHPRGQLTEAVIKAFRETGIRGIVARGYLTLGEEFGVPKPLIEPIDKALSDACHLIEQYNQPGARVQVGLAPCMIWSVDQDTLDKTRRLASDLKALITIHISETPFELENSMQRFGMPDLQYLQQIGFLGPDVLAVHCVYCEGQDIDILKRHQVKVSHNPCSNMYLASGFAPIPEMLSQGVTVSLACDGPASNNNSNMIHTLKFGALIHKGYHRDPTIITAEKVLEMATIDGARAVGLEHEIGSIEPGKKADLVILKLDNVFVTPVHAPVSSLVYSALGNEPETVLVDGQIVMKNRQMVTVSEEEVMRESQKAADDLAKRAGTDRFKRRPWRSYVP
ncbi:amidohydrolase [Leptothermofonsia sichuanensis E412]|uniref:amidohydrolase family protein n=1 Tax=Leptothermofonsia sichuanensis TaxID=2917832 RepID=UPI001CA73C30|nr:amidohydrolase [Leptothermofonsia sichuanensis]QZZ19569.1 amidohydrolase [Leptothermofonsia sichuanensis E412]